MSETEAAILAQLIERLSAVRRDRTQSQSLGRWADICLDLEPGDVGDVLVEICCEWENILSAADESGAPERLMHLEFPDASLAGWLTRAATIR